MASETTTEADAVARARELWSGPARGLWIDNDYVDAASDEEIVSENPATGERLGAVQAASPEDVQRAVDSARRALDVWAKVSPDDRGRLLHRVSELVEEHHDELSALETLECGKPIAFTGGYDLPSVAGMFRYFAGWCTKHTGQVIPVSNGNFLTYTRHEPVGVCAGIIPWNSPLSMASWKLGPALACGNVMIIKPAEQTPLTMLRLAELIREAGVPPGVVNVLPGYGEVAGAALAGHEQVDKVAFTGEYLTGQKIVAASAGNLKRVSLELGGKSPNVVFADAPDDVVEGSLWGIFYNSGQSCSAGSRLFVHKDRYDDVVGGLTEAASKLTIGPGIRPATEIGPLISQGQLDRVVGYIDGARSEGATVVGGERPESEQLTAGYFVSPTVVSDTSNDARIAREEVFGPVVTAMPFASEEELVSKANDSVFGLGAGVWTSDIKRAHRVAAAIKAGTVWINCYGMADPAAPFGGFRMSGYGREMGSYALELYSEVKCVWTKLD
jgi:acyl-CoA reductase-like NAD-dependent aldehyde dehydrogenase